MNVAARAFSSAATKPSIFIACYTIANGESPTMKEIAVYFGITRLGAMLRVRTLCKLGFIEYRPKAGLPIRILEYPVKRQMWRQP